MRLRVGEQVGEVLRHPAFRAEQAAEKRHAGDMVVVEVAEEHDVDPVDAELAAERLDAMKQHAPP